MTLIEFKYINSDLTNIMAPRYRVRFNGVSTEVSKYPDSFNASTLITYITKLQAQSRSLVMLSNSSE
jgi:hypothetical protein